VTDKSLHEEMVCDDSVVPFLQIKNLSKMYSRMPPPAVDDVTFTFYQNQITALLGFNGAGKSSLLGMVTGLITSTSGDCYVGGKSIKYQTFLARQMIGFCPQENILFDRLSVYEHINMFLILHGRKASEENVVKLVNEVGLIEFLHIRAHALSGGNKRKLSLAIALSGDSRQKLLVVDEPTSGMGKSFSEEEQL
jgi:ABC-type multidrug transport system ATPase subunit